METSIFEVLGPVMIGPSSSHTAGAARIARIARAVADEDVVSVVFGLHGSFAKTYKGHGTDKALVAGILGMREDDEDIRNSFSIAREKGMEYRFREVELSDAHENTVLVETTGSNNRQHRITGASVGGGSILITNIDGFEVEITAENPVIIIKMRDKKGVISEITALLANNNINIAVMRVSRKGKGSEASTIIETDDRISLSIIERLSEIKYVDDVKVMNFAVEKGI
ncbi:L-serine dehydratase, beta chain [Ruminiclostridium hungatei]|uniref:L-serine deaminase n=1 Tax=Ruminiclostridium hungatei TaxID=48256 RepID=A0A1V4SJN4_RUMHU|nr:L-serine ammonia-lyase, iron-sulfur-dependent subunit beta [Ruminiclostridium hungatei]OPX44024.1 L-serine dehydratase, beta chain [Ruminiclostridium hungatei]